MNGVEFIKHFRGDDRFSAGDGVEALRVFQKSQVGLELTDWKTPNKSGLELTREIRALGSKVPTFMITTESVKGRVVKAIQAGITNYLEKPFTQDMLQPKLEKYARA